MRSLGGKILGLFISVGLIIGGLSGEMVLRGTNSSDALVVAGFLFLAWDIYSLATHNKKKRKEQEIAEERAKEANAQSEAQSSLEASGQTLTAPASVTVIREGSMLGAAIAYKVYLNGAYAGDVKNGGQLTLHTTAPHNIVSFFDKYSNPFKEDVAFDITAGESAEIFVKAGRVLTERTRVASASGTTHAQPAVTQPLLHSDDSRSETAVSQPEQPARAIWVMALVLLFMAVSAFSFSRAIGRSYDITNALLALSFSLFLGACIYLLSQDGARYKIISVIGLLVGTAIYSFAATYLRVYAARMQAPPFDMLFRSPEFGGNLRGNLIAAGIVGVLTAVISAVCSGQNKKRLAWAAWGSAMAVTIWRFFNLRLMLMDQRLPLIQKIGATVSAVDSALCIALFALLVAMLCSLKHKELRTGSGAKVWFGVCVVSTPAAVIASIATNAIGVAQVAVAVVGVVGYILLLASRRAGFPIVLTAVLMNAAAGVNAGLLGYKPSAANVLIPLIGLANPFITWLVIRNKWDNDSPADNQPAVLPAKTEKKKVNAAFKIASIVDILLGGVLFTAAAFSMIESGRFIQEPFLFGIIPGAALVALGVVAAVQCFGRISKARRWFLILQLVIASLGLGIIAVAVISSVS